MITVEQLEADLGPASNWGGRCYEIACVAARLAGGTPIYGHYLGQVTESSRFFAAHRACRFTQHGWVLLPDGQVLDPTRWEFEGQDPYLYVGPGDEYDEGGNGLRTLLAGDAPEFDPVDDVMNISPHLLNSDAWSHIEHRLGLENMLMSEDYEPGDITLRQLQWIANQDPRSMRGNASAIYRMLGKLKMKGLVPIDNWMMVERSPM